MATVSMMVGNVGSGKSLLSSKLAKLTGAVVVNMDTIQQMMGGGEYGRYDAGKKDIYQATEKAAITSALALGQDVVIDRTNVDKKRRAKYIEMVKGYTTHIDCYDFGPGKYSDVARRQKNSRGVPNEKWEDVHNFMHESYEEPSPDEGFENIIVPPKKFKFYAFDFDGTIAGNKFPEIGEIIDGTVERMNRLYEDLANIIIVWSCRGGNFESQMRQFLLGNKIPFDFINENPMFETGSRKIFAHVYYDDRGVTP